MNRYVALICALVLSALVVGSACIAAPGDGIHASFGHNDSYSSGFMPSELIGVDLAGFRRSGTRPLRIALVRELLSISG
jgi:hypothetical protein